MLHASIYQLPDRLLVHPSRYTEAGFRVSGEPYVSIQKDASEESIGSEILNALAQSKGVVPTPTDWKSHSASLHAAAGVKSATAFQKSAKLVTVEMSEKTITLEPTHNGGTKGDTKGFYGKPEKKLFLPVNTSAGELGLRVREALGQCTT